MTMAFDFILRTTLKHVIPYIIKKINNLKHIVQKLITFSFLKLASYRESQKLMKVRDAIIEIHLSLQE